MIIASGLTGNEILCLSEMGFAPGDLVMGNSVLSLGVQGGISSALLTMSGGEIKQVTKLVRDCRNLAYDRMVQEATKAGAAGIVGISLDLVQHLSCQELLCMGSEVRKPNSEFFSTSADGQDLYCQLDAGYDPLKFIFGNVAYAIGFANSIKGSIHSMGRGEVSEFSEVLYTTRLLALERLLAEAKAVGANSVLGVQTIIRPFFDIQEMMMLGTASFNENLPPECSERPVTSSLSNSELWGLTKLGYVPCELLLGVSVYSIGLVGGVTASVKQLMGGEISELTELISEARTQSISKMKHGAHACGAKRVVGVKTYVYDLGAGMLEFLTIGTAIKKVDGVSTESELILPQALMREQDHERVTFRHVSTISATAASTSADTLAPQSTDGQIVDNTVNALIKDLPKQLFSFMIPFAIFMVLVIGFLWFIFARGH